MPRVSLAAAMRCAPEPDGDGDPRPRMLLVEDNAVNQRVGVVMVEKRGYRVDVASNGFEAIDAMSRGGYAAVLMDCQMPKLDGYSATTEIRRREGASERIPIIAMTADAGPGAREKCLASGMDDYISKPMVGDELDRVLRKWAPIAAMAGQGARPAGAWAASSSAASGGRPVAVARASPIDPAALDQLRQSATETPDLVLEVIDLFLDEMPDRLNLLRDGLSRSDLPLIRAWRTPSAAALGTSAREPSPRSARALKRKLAPAPCSIRRSP